MALLKSLRFPVLNPAVEQVCGPFSLHPHPLPPEIASFPASKTLFKCFITNQIIEFKALLSCKQPERFSTVFCALFHPESRAFQHISRDSGSAHFPRALNSATSARAIS